jgi:hypothetical protein
VPNNTKGYFEETGGDGYSKVEGETYTCCHCNSVHDVIRGAPFGMCHQCWKPVCDVCNAKGRCMPFEKKIEAYERRWRAAESRRTMLRGIGV